MKHFLTGMMLVFPVLLYAQSDFKKGYVVTASKDTLTGYIDIREQLLNPSEARFRVDPKSNTQIFRLDDLVAYGAMPFLSYEKYKVKISMDPVKLNDLMEGQDTSSKTAVVLLKVLQRGKHLTLFSYVDEIKERFYILNSEQTVPVELLRFKYLGVRNTNSVINVNRYRKQLFVEMNKYNPNAVSEKDMNNLMFDESELMQVVSVINGERSNLAAIKGSRIFAGLGVSGTKINYIGSHQLSRPGSKSNTSYMPYITAGIDVFSNPSNAKLVYRAELSVFNAKSEVTNKNGAKQTFDQLTFSISPQLIYNVYSTTAFKLFGGVGLGFNIISSSNNLFVSGDVGTSEQIELKQFNISYFGKVGTVIRNKLEVSVGYSPAIGAADYSGFKINAKSLLQD